VIPDPTFIYHMTCADNLPFILSDWGLLSKRVLRQMGRTHVSIAYEGVQDIRAHWRVNCGPRGVLHDYVPFYFAPRSPMLYAISRGNVAGYQRGQEPIIHLVTTAQAVEASGQRFVFTDGHAIKKFTGYFHTLTDLAHVDWDIMQARYWSDTDDDNDRRRRRQAEFLVHSALPWELIDEIGVYSASMKRNVEAIVSTVRHQPAISVRRDWYYESFV
jgi:hypothetical protein